ncbi:MAG: GAF domain-containing protein [Dehalococcoidia bacterium]|nr:GAF domain-containing protein [Dehalococcoidia bacterium]
MQLLQHNITYIQCLIEDILAVTEQTLKASASSVLLADQENHELCFQFVGGPAQGILKEARLGTETGISGWVALHGKPVMVNDVTADERFCKDMDEITGFTTRSILCAPLVARGKLIGVIEVLNRVDGSDFSEQDLQTLVAVASIAAAAIDLKLAEEALRHAQAHYVELVANLTEKELELFSPGSPSEELAIRPDRGSRN